VFRRLSKAFTQCCADGKLLPFGKVGKVFLLSIAEVFRYFGGQVGGQTPTGTVIDQYAPARNASGGGDWWLRSPGYGGDYAAYIRHGGNVSIFGTEVSAIGAGVRPAMWLILG
jgi:hypothetical protein